MPSHGHGVSNNGDHFHYIANTKENNGSNGVVWLNDSTYLVHKDTHNSYENFELRGSNDYASVGKTSNSGSHSHQIYNTGGNGYHENRPPYLVVNMWKRTA